jgi:hypothetical protein
VNRRAIEQRLFAGVTLTGAEGGFRELFDEIEAIEVLTNPEGSPRIYTPRGYSIEYSPRGRRLATGTRTRNEYAHDQIGQRPNSAR